MLVYAVYADKKNISRHFVSERQSRGRSYYVCRRKAVMA